MLLAYWKSLTIEVVILLPALANAQLFTVNCSPLTIQRSDPIVSPGTLSSHVHSIIGGTAFQQNMSATTAVDAELTTCDRKIDKSNYWVPQLYHYRADNQYEIVEFQGSAVYYLVRVCGYSEGKTQCEANAPIQAPPAGLRMIAGTPSRRTYDANSFADQAISHVCLTQITSSRASGDIPGSRARPDLRNSAGPETFGMPTSDCLRMRSQVFFPSCWDGVNLDSADHKSHLAYPAFGSYNGGVCPSSHPVALLSVFFEFFYNTEPYADTNFVWAMGDTTGYGFHGDFLNGWNQSVLDDAITTCQGPNGSDDPNCSVNEGIGSSEILPPEVSAPAEDVGLDGPLAALPGNNPVDTSVFLK